VKLKLIIVRFLVIKSKIKLLIRNNKLQPIMKEKVDTKIMVKMDIREEITKVAITEKEKKVMKRGNTSLSILQKNLNKNPNKIMDLILILMWKPENLEERKSKSLKMMALLLLESQRPIRTMIEDLSKV
jgi:hypothetical protein